MSRFIPLLFALVLSSACAKTDTTTTTGVVLSADELTKKLAASRPDLVLSSIEDSDMQGFYLAQIANGPEIYLSKDGKHLIAGDVFAIGDQGLIDLREQRLAGQRQQAVGDLVAAKTITFSPDAAAKATVFVFTDVDCGYCQKLHREMPAYNAAGIEVRYLAYPRAGINSPAYRKMASAWCASDKNSAMTKLKQREAIPENVCDGNPVAEHYALGRKFGVRGTPAIMLQDGRMLPGYRDAKTLAAELGL